MIEKQHIGVDRGGRSRDLLKLPCSDQSCSIRPVTSLKDFANDSGPGTFGKGLQFSEGFLRIEFRNAALTVGGRAGCSIVSRRFEDCSLRCGRVPSRSSLGGNRPLAAPGADVQAHQERAFALRCFASGTCDGHSPARTRRIAGFLAMRTSQAEKAYPSVPEAVAAVAAGTGPPAAFSECGACATWVDATRPITTVEIACLKMSCS
jgi:hypothetical protein